MNDLLTEQDQQRSRVIKGLRRIRTKFKLQLGHSDLILKNLVKGHMELPYATTMLKQTNLAERFCKIRSKVMFSMCSQIIGNKVTVIYI